MGLVNAQHDQAAGRERCSARPADAVAGSKTPRVAYLETDGVLPMTREFQPERCLPAEPGARGGKVESANYHVTGARLKCQGMRWDEKGAAQMALLRADLFNDRWDGRTRQMLAA